MDDVRVLNLNEALNQATFAFAELVGLDAEKWSDQSMIEELNQSRDLDSTGLTTFMLLKALLDEALATTTFSASSVLADPDGFSRRMDYVRTVKAAVEHPDAMQLAAAFAERVRSALAGTGADSERLDELFAEPGQMALLRRDALRSIDTLQAHHFVIGERSHNHLALNRTVFEFWNVNSLLSLLRLQDLGGTTLCLIRDPAEVMASFFVFAIKNGDDITLLTDREDVPHPAFWKMSRRPDRRLARRAERHHFPYHLLDLEPTYSRSGLQNGFTAASRTALVPLQMDLAPLTSLGALNADELAWVVMLHDKINERYAGPDCVQPTRLAYTGEMVRSPDALIGSAGALARTGVYQHLDVEPLTRGDVSAESTAEQWQRTPCGHNEWMIERYGDRVPDSILNPIGEREVLALRGAHPLLLGPSKEEQESLPFWDRKKSLAIESLNPMAFGSAEDIERDRLWVARVNQCRVVQHEAELEYERTKGEVGAWYVARLQERLPFILEAIATGSLLLTSIRREGFDRHVAPMRREALRIAVGVKSAGDFSKLVRGGMGYGAFRLGRLDDAARLGYRCAVDDATAASVFATIAVDCGQAIAELLGIDVRDLPIGLRHWLLDPPYHGNQILDRLDPSDWVLSNPWEKMRLDVFVSLSRRAYNAERKRLGLPRA